MINLLLAVASDANVANKCSNSGFFGFPTWYKYLKASNVGDVCNPKLEALSDVWLIGAAILEILLRVAAIVAVGFIIYGGIQYIISQGEPDKTKQARSTIINALGGLGIAIFATAIVTFLARSIK